MNSTGRPDCTSLCPMAHSACVLPVPDRPNASKLTPRPAKSPSARLPNCCLSFTGARSCSNVSQVLPAGSFDALLNLSTLRMRLSSASCSSTYMRVGRASACPGSLKRPTISAASVGSLNSLHSCLCQRQLGSLPFSCRCAAIMSG